MVCKSFADQVSKQCCLHNLGRCEHVTLQISLRLWLKCTQFMNKRHEELCDSTLLVGQGGATLPELALIKSPEQAGGHALDGLAGAARLHWCTRHDRNRGCLAPCVGPLYIQLNKSSFGVKFSVESCHEHAGISLLSCLFVGGESLLRTIT